jgi:hypothetical protein
VYYNIHIYGSDTHGTVQRPTISKISPSQIRPIYSIFLHPRFFTYLDVTSRFTTVELKQTPASGYIYASCMVTWRNSQFPMSDFIILLSGSNNCHLVEVYHHFMPVNTANKWLMSDNSAAALPVLDYCAWLTTLKADVVWKPAAVELKASFESQCELILYTQRISRSAVTMFSSN